MTHSGDASLQLKPLPFRALDLGDTALTLEFGNRIDPELQSAVLAMDARIADALASGELVGIVETVPSFRSLTLIFDPLLTDRTTLLDKVERLSASGPDQQQTPDRRLWTLPICYDTGYAPDLDDVACSIGLSRMDTIDLHLNTEYRVYMLGFLPGFPFMGDIPPTLRLPRRNTPRTRVPAGSVAIANALTAIYPWESPGGWHLLGRCPVPLFNPARDQPALLSPGDRVRFTPVSAQAFNQLDEAMRHQDYDIEAHCLQGVSKDSE